MTSSPVVGTVRVVGAGLIGASVGLALSRTGVTVLLSDPSPTAAALASDLGAGRVAGPADPMPDLVVVAAPPDVTAAVVATELLAWPSATVTDVASVKGEILTGVQRELAARGADPGAADRYVGSHPMAGRERSGAVAAREDLFVGRPWVIADRDGADAAAVFMVDWLVAAVGASPVRMAADCHDAAVAAVSHAPQVAASLVAARLRDLPIEAVSLAGQGVRDVTRIAESDPVLWTQILAGNAESVSQVLVALQQDLGEVVAALHELASSGEAAGARAVLARTVAAGQAGRARIPGKHGAAPTRYGVVTVVVPDEPGRIARLLTDVGEAGVNLEDLRLEHDLGREVGVVELLVVPAVVESLAQALIALGWKVHV
ncbi:prephenate dehydrogenase [Austwickia sp. TVS 96-490-7B]|uniref:prephenate dehydrogenase n=1 Tax=Austwickia sp. TVS 96-490-7B TaxID=2830843 RepID=UPI00210572A8|nr:prephenate dehydrogenase [Austwickia sp. TVS 96-490-7B]